MFCPFQGRLQCCDNAALGVIFPALPLYVEVDLVLVFFVREFDVVDVSVLRVVFAEHLRALDEAVQRGSQEFKEAAADLLRDGLRGHTQRCIVLARILVCLHLVYTCHCERLQGLQGYFLGRGMSALYT